MHTPIAFNKTTNKIPMLLYVSLINMNREKRIKTAIAHIVDFKFLIQINLL